jgi:caa(3)-type oxidase subunit IV
MTDERNNEPEPTDEEIKDIAESVPGPDEYPEGQAEELEEHIEAEHKEDVFEEAVVDTVEVTEELEDTASVKAFGKAVTAVQETIEKVGGPPETPEEALTREPEEHFHGDVTEFRGKIYDIPIYTSVFISLGVLTITEVLISEIFTAEVISVPLLLTFAVAKVFLVVYFYMHLNTDSRIFAITLLIPIVVGLLSAMFLFSVPAGY